MPLIDFTHLIWLKMMKILISSSHFWVCASRLIFEIGKNDTDVVICWICYVEFDMHAYGYQSCFSCCWLCFEFRNIYYNRLLLIPLNLKNGKYFKIHSYSFDHENIKIIDIEILNSQLGYDLFEKFRVWTSENQYEIFKSWFLSPWWIKYSKIMIIDEDQSGSCPWFQTVKTKQQDKKGK